MSAPRVAIIGGGLAGLAAALRLAEQGLRVELFEARRTLGGRAASFRDPATGEWIDHCQHVAMACCTNFHDFCRRAGISGEFDRYDTLHFFGPDGRRCDFRASRWLPPPLHLAGALWRQKYLTVGERMGIARALLRLARQRSPHALRADTSGGTPPVQLPLTAGEQAYAAEAAKCPHAERADYTIGHWLRAHGQSQRAIDLFWSVVLVSALGETVDRAAFAPARKVFVDGFMANRAGYQVDVPRRSLRELLDERVAAKLTQLGVIIHRQMPVEHVLGDDKRLCGLRLAAGNEVACDGAIIAVPWRRVWPLVPESLQTTLNNLQATERIASSPISGVHLWFDRAITDLPHAVLVGRLSQWLFRREVGGSHYYQVVISASRDLSALTPEQIISAVRDDLRSVFPAARAAVLHQAKVVTEREAVFSYTPEFTALRPGTQTAIPNLFLAGDYVQTGWPATLESAVRSGYLAAEGVLQQFDQPAKLMVDDLPRGWFIG
jgi:squalene-associated FAD-dependent desaturase